MSELIGTLSELFAFLEEVQNHAPVIAAVAAIPMLSVMSWKFVSKRARLDGSRPAPLTFERPTTPTTADNPNTPDPLALYRDFANKRKAHLLVLPTAEADDLSDSTLHEASVRPLHDFLYVYRQIPSTSPIDILIAGFSHLQTSEIKRLASILKGHQGKVTAIIPYRAEGPGCLLAFAADEIRMSRDATLLFDAGFMNSEVKAAAIKGRRRMSDKALIELHRTQHRVRETEALARTLLVARKSKRPAKIAKEIGTGKRGLANPVRAADLQAWGLTVHVENFIENYELPPDTNLTVASASTERPNRTIAVAPTCAEACPVGDVRAAMTALQARRNSRLISIIHAEGTSSDSVDDKTVSEALKAIRASDPNQNLDIILHTPGGNALGAIQLVRALKEHRGRKTFYVPYEAFSAGTILALSGDEICLSDFSCLGPIDVQISFPGVVKVHNGGFVSLISKAGSDEDETLLGGPFRAFVRSVEPPFGASAAALASLLKFKHPKDIDDKMLKYAVIARDMKQADHKRALAIMSGNYSRWAANRIAHYLNDGTLSHGYPVQYEEAKKIGLKVSLGIPDEVYTIVDSFLFQEGDFCSVIHCSGE